MPRRLFTFCLLLLSAAPLLAADPPRVKLAVHVVFDQMRGDYVDRWRPLFGNDGIKKIQDQDAWFAQCYYPYANTSTGPGHSIMLSGTTLDRTGIVNNDWYDRASGVQVYCAGSDRYKIVPPIDEADKTAKKAKATAIGNPDRMLAETLGDVVKRETKGKVFGLSLKDRSAILPTGKRPDGAYWFLDRFVTSTYYRDSLPSWVSEFNNSGEIKKWYGKNWDRLLPGENYEKYSGPDSVKGESNINGQGIVFPHPTTGGKTALGPTYYEALANSPYGNQMLLEFMKTCVIHEKLGQGEASDLLVVSFSSNDLIGHTFGPDSQEVLDVTLRSDRLIAEMLKFLDEKVGAGKYAVTITADHGICPLPEVSASQGKDAKRVSPTGLITGAERHLRDTFGKPNNEEKTVGKSGLWLEAVAAPWIYLNDRLIQAKGLDKAKVAASLAEYLRKQPDVYRAFTAEEMAKDTETTDPILTLARRSYYPGRAGDLYVCLKPYYLLGSGSSGTNHGTPHDYDRHVPLLVYGPDLIPGRTEEAVTPQHSAAILAKFLGVSVPKDATYALPKKLFVK